MSGRAVIGPLTGKRLSWLPCEVTTWGEWKRRHPKTTVLKPVFSEERYKATHRRYEQYRRDGVVRFPVAVRIDPAYRDMERVVIVDTGGKARCYPLAELSEGTQKDGERTIRRAESSVVVTGADGKPLAHMTGYWFAWCAYYPQGSVYKRSG